MNHLFLTRVRNAAADWTWGVVRATDYRAVPNRIGTTGNLTRTRPRRARRMLTQQPIRFMMAMVGLLMAGTAVAEVQTRSVEYESEGVKLTGFVAWDDSAPGAGEDGKRPGILVVHEFWGLNAYAKDRTRRFAELGYVAFAVDMYGEGRATEHAQEARAWAAQLRGDLAMLRKRAVAGLEAIRSQPGVDPTRIGAVGYCFGGTAVLQLAFSGADVGAVVSVHGNPLPPEEAELAGIKASLLLCHGADDPAVSQASVTAFQDAMRSAKADWMVVQYGNAVHSFSNPSVGDVPGRSSRYDARADRRSWAHLTDFLAERLNHPVIPSAGPR